MDKTMLKKIRRRNINRLRRESRVKLVIAILLIFALIMGAGVRVIYLNINKGTEYKKEVLSQQSYVNKVINYKRGDIVDRNGNTLAKSTKVYDLILEPKQVIEADENRQAADKDADASKKATAAALKKVFGISEKTFYSILSKKPNSMYYPMKKYTSIQRKIVEEFNKLADEDSL